MNLFKNFQFSFWHHSVVYVMVFLFGLMVARFEIPPFSMIQATYHSMKTVVDFRDDEDEIILPNLDASFLVLEKKIIESISQGVELRKKLSDRVILPRDSIQLNTDYLSEKKEKIQASFYGITITSILEKADNSTCLRIYIQGHGGDPFKFDSHKEIRKSSLEGGCDFLSMSMLGLGLNSGEVSFPGRQAFIELSAGHSNNHENFQYYFDMNNASKDPLALFLSGHFYTITDLLNDYQKTSIIGFSGGAWYTVWLSALIPEIGTSISYAGSLPLAYHHFFDGYNDFSYNPGDWEQTGSDVYDNYDYWDLYALMTVDRQGSQNRKTYHIYNNNDNCCFRDPSASQFKFLWENSSLKDNEVIILENNEHNMNAEVVLSLLLK
jgi:hypothetical protein